MILEIFSNLGDSLILFFFCDGPNTRFHRVVFQLYIVGGSFGLREFAQIRYDVHKLHGKVDPALKEKLKQNNVTLESEYKKLEKSDFDNWENIRGPQLWEDSRTVQKQRREAARLKTE
ncbi:cytochrome c oxidase assembly protein COX16 homolog, mitochondrial isoform X2 [Meleagris gallopavo]|uniref:Cytochrome c oxidase assembly protein COX16 homolog, mitochondrial n=1 Tax=Meleagris gallopavo TaxID=9103 RepID=G1NGX0_MELGA|nr:cytochrome c oxidase assembly protein COX16 homolog, mitochondrial isoform X2 [Meleagris gallopavo]